MRYILNNEGYVETISFTNPIVCNGSCTEYTGTIPEGYSSLLEWSENAVIQAYKITNGNLTHDPNKEAELEEQWENTPSFVNRTIRFQLTSEFSVPKSEFTPIPYNQKVIFAGEDFCSIDSTGIISINEPGLYLFLPAIAFNTNTTGGRYQDVFDSLYLAANGACSGVGVNGLRTCFSSSCILSVNETMINEGTNTFRHRAYQTSGNALGIAPTGTFLTIMKLL